MKVQVSKTVSEEIDVELPIYGSWDGDIDGGRYSWETRFWINEQLEYRSLTRRWGDSAEWSMEYKQLSENELGQYVKYDREQAADYLAWFEEFQQTVLVPE